jgi:hypothetical protein
MTWWPWWVLLLLHVVGKRRGLAGQPAGSGCGVRPDRRSAQPGQEPARLVQAGGAGHSCTARPWAGARESDGQRCGRHGAMWPDWEAQGDTVTVEYDEHGRHGAPRRKREVEVRESIKRTRIRKTKEVSLKRTTRRTSEWKRNSLEMSEVARKARRIIAGSSQAVYEELRRGVKGATSGGSR